MRAIASRKRSCRVSGGSGAWCLFVVTSIPSLPCADAGLIALGVGQHPKRRCRIVGQQAAARRDRRVDPCAGRLVRHVDVDVDPIALRPRRIHLLEPDCRTTRRTGRPAPRCNSDPGSSAYPVIAFQNGRTSGMSSASMAISSACTARRPRAAIPVAASAPDTSCASRTSRPVTPRTSADCSRSTARSERMSTVKCPCPSAPTAETASDAASVASTSDGAGTSV